MTRGLAIEVCTYTRFAVKEIEKNQEHPMGIKKHLDWFHHR